MKLTINKHDSIINLQSLIAIDIDSTHSSVQALSNVEVVRCDVAKDDDLASVATEIRQNHGKLDFAINVSGILHPSGRGETRLQVGNMYY